MERKKGPITSVRVGVKRRGKRQGKRPLERSKRGRESKGLKEGEGEVVQFFVFSFVVVVGRQKKRQEAKLNMLSSNPNPPAPRK